MSRVTPAQTNFNGGEISRRLRGRIDLSIYEIALGQMVGWVPLPEGGAEACPGLLWVEQAKAECRLLPFEFNVTQGYVLEMSAGWCRFYTNDARIEDEGEPVEIALPYSLEQIRALDYTQSFDVLYLFHGLVQTQQLVRNDADSFALEAVEFVNGPWEPRNQVETLTVSASAVTGTVTLTASAALFEEGDVGGLFQLEAGDFGSVASWQPGITVTNGQYLTWLERVYRIAGGSGRTGTVEPIHTEGVEWDGIGAGTDINGTAAGGAQLEYVHDRFGIMKITDYISPTQVTAEVTRRLPFTAVTGTPTWEEGYWDPEWGVYVPPVGGVTYSYGTWRWRFGAFSTRRGFPQAGAIWNERLWLVKDSIIYGGVVGDFLNHATYNENGDISADMAIVITLKDPNQILGLVAAGNRLVALTSSGVFSIGPASPASPLGPGNIRADRESNSGCSAAKAAEVDGRIVYIGRSEKRVFEAQYEVTRDRQDSIELTRYARQIGNPRLIELAAMKDPERLLWAVRGDGSLCCSAYVPEEEVLGWARRPLATGMAAKSCCVTTAPDGRKQQLWASASIGGVHHVLRLADFREDGEHDDNAPMLDLAVEYDGEPESAFNAPPLAGMTAHIVADGKWLGSVNVAENGDFSLNAEYARVVAGLPFDAMLESLPLEAGGDNGPAMSKMQRVGDFSLLVEHSRGCNLHIDGGMEKPLEQLEGSSSADDPFTPVSGLLFATRASGYGRRLTARVKRVAPYQATILAWQPRLETAQK